MYVRNQKFEDYLTGEGVDPLRFGPFTRLAFNMHGLVPPEEWLDIMPQMFHVHAKFYDIDENGDEPAMDIPRIVRQFVEGGYQGYLSSEWEGHAFSDLGESDPIDLVKKQHTLMRRAIEDTVAATGEDATCLTPSHRASIAELQAELATLRDEVAAVARPRPAAQDRGAVENVFNRYMYLHNAFQDEQIIPLWVKRGTEGIRARYTNAGEYTEYDSVIRYHQGRPSPEGKLILHATTTPVIEVAADGKTAKGVWLMAGTESGLTDPEVAKEFPDMYSPGEVLGKKVWAHWVWCKYAIDFLKQDGEWKIWKFRCYELARAPFEENWISFGQKNQGAFDLDLMYFGDDGKPVFMPPADQPVPVEEPPVQPVDRAEARAGSAGAARHVHRHLPLISLPERGAHHGHPQLPLLREGRHSSRRRDRGRGAAALVPKPLAVGGR